MTYLESSYYFDFEDDVIQTLISEYRNKSVFHKDAAIALYTKIRDNWKYDPYNISLSERNYKASSIAVKTTGNCVDKSILLIACLRGLGIPARLQLGKVKNHIAVERLIEKFGTNELTPHGMVNVYLVNKWLKVSPAFNSSLCHKLNVRPLEFDGEKDACLQEFNSEGNQFMEYIDDYGHFEDVPLKFMEKNIKAHYPNIFDTKERITEFKL